MKINVGCGRRPLAGYVNLDLVQYPGVDYEEVEFLRCDVCAPAFSDWLDPLIPVAEIRATQFLEHLTPDDGRMFLGRCCAALRGHSRRSHGVLHLEVPDWAAHVADYLDRQQRVPLHSPAMAAGPFRPEVNVMLSILYDWGHRTIYDEEMLETVVTSAGFRIVHLAHPDGANVVLDAQPA